MFKKCKFCAGIRQAQLSDIAELASRFSRHAYYSVVMPFEQSESLVKKLKTNIIRKLRNNATGGLVSIETTANDSLHLNVIINSDNVIVPTLFNKSLKNLNTSGDVFFEEIMDGSRGVDIATQMRKITSYSLKKQSIPSNEQYRGNTANKFGNWRSITEIFHSQKIIKQNPSIAVASIVESCNRLGILLPSNSDTSSAAVTDIVYLINQLDKFGKCYSNKHGLMSLKQFQNLYERWLLLPSKFKNEF